MTLFLKDCRGWIERFGRWRWDAWLSNGVPTFLSFASDLTEIFESYQAILPLLPNYFFYHTPENHFV